MSVERYIVDELAGACVTLTELLAIATIVRENIKDPEFIDQFHAMTHEIANCYEVIVVNMQPVLSLESQAEFAEEFDQSYHNFKECYLHEISKPRSYLDEAYEHYLLLMNHRSSKTAYPLLKRTFLRLEQLVDKWITNDAWLAMGIDGLFKRLNNLLNEIFMLKQKDTEEAYIIFKSALDCFVDYMSIVVKNREMLYELLSCNLSENILTQA